MKIQKGFMTAIIVIGLLLGTFTAVQAVPPLPSSFHGTVKVNGANVPEGTAITAWINGTQYAQTQTLMYAGDSVYAIDVPGDDSSTPGVIEGGKAGDTIVFKIDGVTADQTAIWTSGTYPSRDLSAKVITVTADSKSKTYGDADPVFSYTYSPNTPAVAFEGALGRETGENVGAYEITIGTLSAPGYTIIFNTASLTINPEQITVTALARSKIYGQVDPVLSYQTAPSLVTGDSFTGGLARVGGEKVGAYAILQGILAINDGNNGENYNITYVSADLTINRRVITIRADDKMKLVGNLDPPLTYTITTGTLAFEDKITGGLARDAGETIGTYPIRQGTLVIDDGNAGLNYDLSFNNGALTISQLPLTITAQPATKVYGEADPVLTYLASDPSVPLTGALSREVGENVGEYAITIGTLSAGDEYDIVFVSDDLTITARPITITADDKEKVEGELDPELTFNITDGFLVFEDEIVGELEREPGEVAGLYDILIGSLQIGDGNNGDNYLLTYIKGIFTIHQGINTIYLPLIFK